MFYRILWWKYILFESEFLFHKLSYLSNRGYLSKLRREQLLVCDIYQMFNPKRFLWEDGSYYIRRCKLCWPNSYDCCSIRFNCHFLFQILEGSLGENSYTYPIALQSWLLSHKAKGQLFSIWAAALPWVPTVLSKTRCTLNYANLLAQTIAIHLFTVTTTRSAYSLGVLVWRISGLELD
jgi:hypothetical protein